MYDAAATLMPTYDNMDRDQAIQAFVHWVDATWDFNKKSEHYKQVASQMRTVAEIRKLTMNTAASGLLWKAKGIK